MAELICRLIWLGLNLTKKLKLSVYTILALLLAEQISVAIFVSDVLPDVRRRRNLFQERHHFFQFAVPPVSKERQNGDPRFKIVLEADQFIVNDQGHLDIKIVDN